MVIKEFHSGELFGIKCHDISVRTGVKIVTVGAWLSEEHKFRLNCISSEGVSNAQQSLRFSSREDAQKFIDLYHNNFGYERSEMQIMNTRVDAEYMPVEVPGISNLAWTQMKKWESTSDSAKERIIHGRPELYGENASLETLNQSQQEQEIISKYRGFRF